MVFFGKIKGTKNEWGFDVFEKTFKSYIEVNDDEHIKIIEKANNEGKLISGDENGNPILIDPPAPTKKEQIRQRVAELELYLSQTDWYAIRFADTGEPMPEEIKQKRQEARDEISSLRND